MKKISISKRVLIPILILLVLIFAASLHRCKEERSTSIFRTTTIGRGDLLITISATGTIEPEEVIDVGAQVAGQILSFGTDKDGKSVDYGSVVSKGMVLARIDPSVYEAEAAIAEAELEAAVASKKRAEADQKVFQATFRKAERDWQRAQKIGPSEALAQSRYDEYLAGYEIGKSNLAVAEAAILQAGAAITKSKAALTRANRNVSYCTITSPVDGIIIDRRVNIGQTVVASLNAPSLFLLAKDLKRMQIWVAVNEADVSRIQPNQNVTFTIDALPDETFNGKVGKVRLNAAMTQNVVIYTVEVITDNTSGRLLPYLTANVVFEIDKRSNVLLLPNTVLQWKPSDEMIDSASNIEMTTPADSNKQVVWVPAGKKVRPVVVETGISDRLTTEIVGGGLTEGQEVVIGLVPKTQQQKKESSDQGNPFMPSIPTPPGGGGGGGGSGGGPQR